MSKASRYVPMTDQMQRIREQKVYDAINTPEYQARQMLLRIDVNQELELMSGEKVFKVKNYKGNLRCRTSSGQTQDYKIKKFKFYHVQLALMK